MSEKGSQKSVERIKELLKKFDEFNDKYVEKGNKSAAREARKITMEMRKELQNYKKLSTEETR